MSTSKTLKFEKVYKKHFKKVYNIVRRYVYDTHVIEDVVQDVFVKFWHNKVDQDKKVSKKKQLFTITKSVVLDYLKKEKNTHRLLESYYLCHLGIEQEQNSETDTNWLFNQICAIVKDLPDRQRAVFELHRFDGLTYDEIALTLDISRNTVSNHMAAAVKSIKEKFKEKGLPLVLIATLYPIIVFDKVFRKYKRILKKIRLD